MFKHPYVGLLVTGEYVQWHHCVIGDREREKERDRERENWSADYCMYA